MTVPVPTATRIPITGGDSGDAGGTSRRRRKPARSIRRVLRRLMRDQRGATGLEFALLLAAIVLPSYIVILYGLDILAEQYRLIVTLNAMPMP